MLGKLIFDDFLFSPVRESRFSMIFDFPPWGKADFRWFLIFPREGKPILIVFWFSLTGDKLVFADFYLSYPYESLFFSFFAHRTPTKASFCRFSFIVPLRKLLSPIFYRLYPVSEWFFAKIDDLLPYLNSFFSKLIIYYRIWTDFHENRRFTPVSERFFHEKTTSAVWRNHLGFLFSRVFPSADQACP